MREMLHTVDCVRGSAAQASLPNLSLFPCTCPAIRVLADTVSGREGFHPKVLGDVGYDLHCKIVPARQNWFDRLVSSWRGIPTYVLWPLQTRSVHSGIRVSMPETMWMMTAARSSARRKRIEVGQGIIDSGYRGELFSILWNRGWRPRLIQDGDRYAQAIFIPALRPRVELVFSFDERDESLRGANGFGSTGR
jgi:dUTP pyrophosphatase